METQISSSRNKSHNNDGKTMRNGGSAKEFDVNGSGDECNGRNNRVGVKKPRIIYNKDFLIECSNYPISRRKPAEFPLPDLGCTLGAMKSTSKLPSSTPVLPPVYLPPRRREEGRGDHVGNYREHREYREHQHPHREYREYRNSRGRDHRDDGDKEPEWFSGGPTSRHETMELRGFMDDERKDKEEKRNRKETAPPSQNVRQDDSDDGLGEVFPPGVSDMNSSLEKILKMESIPGLLNGIVEEEQEEEKPQGMSRFTQIFQRNNSANNSQPPSNSKSKQDGMFLFEQLQQSPPSSSAPPETDKKEIVHDLGNALRSILQITNQQTAHVENVGRPLVEGPVIPVESSQNPINMQRSLPSFMSSPPHHHQQQHQQQQQQQQQQYHFERQQERDVNALQALLQQIILVPSPGPMEQQEMSSIPRPISRPESGMSNPMQSMPAFEIQQPPIAYLIPNPNRPEHYPIHLSQNMMRPHLGNMQHMGNGGGFRPVYNGMGGMPGMGPPPPHPPQHVQMPFNVPFNENLNRPRMPPHMIPREGHAQQQQQQQQQRMGMLPPGVQRIYYY